MFRREGERFVDTLLEISKSLRWQRIHKVEAEIIEARRTCRADCRARLLRRVNAPDDA